MPSGGPLTSFSIRYTPLQSLITHLNAMPVPIGVIACASTTVPVSNATTAATATYTMAAPFTSVVAGMGVHLQADAPGYVGDGPTSAIAIANALAKAKRLDAQEPWVGALNEDNPTGAVQTMNSEGQTLWFIAFVLQSSGSGALFVGRTK